MKECCCLLEDFDRLNTIRKNVVDRSPLSKHIDSIFQSFGMHQDGIMIEYGATADSLISELDINEYSFLSDTILIAAASPALRQKISLLKAFNMHRNNVIGSNNFWRDSAALHYFILAHR